MYKHFFCLFALIVTAACSPYPAEVEHALKLAGDNRAELEKALEHYNNRPEDRLKLQSAYFLIANMPYHFAVQNRALEAFKSYLKQVEPKEGLLTEYEKKYGPIGGQNVIKPDLYYITADFLIQNIDFSFQVWQESPWSKYFTFDVFCEEILPYRLSHEPLEHWKEVYYAAFRPVIDSIADCQNPDELAKRLAEYIKDQGWTWEEKLNSQGFGASILLQKRYGNCKEQADYITYALRSVGIPSGIDFYIHDPVYDTSMHFWNFTRNIEGKSVDFDYYEINQSRVRNMTRKYGKIYRSCHALQKDALSVKYKDLFIPSGGLRNILLKDVSSDYFPNTHITIRSEPPTLFGKKDLAYLCTFDGKTWKPITWSKPKNGMAKFRHVEPELLYQLRLIDETRNIAASKPFILRGNENPQFLDADTSNLQPMTLLRKFRFPYKWPFYIDRPINGKFQGANKLDFSDSVTLHTIQDRANLSYMDVIPERIGKFKYVRYLSANDGYNNMAEVKFYSGGKRLYGNVIGTNGSQNNHPERTKYALFDDDPLTFYDALEADGAWAGLQFDQAYPIEAIRYIFRNDDNNIRPGDSYELLYYSNGAWLLAGKQIADTTRLYYGAVPSNTIYWLRNYTRGKMERPFTYEDGKQIWW